MSESRAIAPRAQLRVGLAGVVGFILSMTAPLGQLIGGAPVLLHAVGSAALWSYVAATGLMLLFAAGLLAAARRIVSAGGLVAFIGVGFGPRVQGAAAYLALVMYTLAGCSTFAGFAALLHDLVPALPVPLIVAADVAIVGALGWREIGLSIRVLVTLLIAELACLLCLDLTILILAVTTGHLIIPHWQVPGTGAGALVWAIGSFGGFEAGLVFGEESRAPGRGVPMAVPLAVAALGGIFGLTYWAAANGCAAGDLMDEAGRDPVSFLYRLDERFLGHQAALAMRLLAMTSVFAASLGVQNVAARYWRVAAREGLLPSGLAAVHPVWGSPYRGSTMQSVIFLLLMGAMVAAGADPMRRILPWCGALAAVATLVLYIASACAVPLLLHRERLLRGRWLQGAVAPLGAALLFVLLLAFALKNSALALHSAHMPAPLWLSLPLAGLAGLIAASRALTKPQA